MMEGMLWNGLVRFRGKGESVVEVGMDGSELCEGSEMGQRWRWFGPWFSLIL
jgi:hypothetical protein